MRDEELARRLVVRRNAGGKCTYDEAAKRELIESCLRQGTSVARVARDYGLNANQLHNWIGLYLKGRGGLLTAPEPIAKREVGSAFIPVVPAKQEETPHDLKLEVTLANGIRADLNRLGLDDVLAILPVLSALPCSASTLG